MDQPNYLIIMKIPTKIIGVCSNFFFMKEDIDKYNDKAFIFKFEEGHFKKLGDINLIPSKFEINNQRLFFGHLNISLLSGRLKIAVESVKGSMPEGPVNIDEIEIYTY
jgi:hypothetical protein